ncbi:class I SAM-dependent methyltransferase [Leifsonia sp. 21MFCrub1.1]|uniref:class I SAM-dependent methyltransferase n=1 Tax=Leifsonia sp. 21MFCrub1.1 TaxID=1798223 RepID=UPI0008927CF7|nr:class I SAM-dependent methyltransferase [Leifsonia sp. 21MFCrub1.1]SEB04454.1 Methyltransferase domain-containing protein [Leifsonia sp. 21MFCrub1.1]
MTDEPADVTATRLAYDTVAEDYADLLRDDLAGSEFDRAMLGVFAEQVTRAGGGVVGDLGCGPGRIAGHLAGLGLDVVGVDLSPAMVEVARRDHPAVRFEVGTMAALPFPDDALAGALAWYSVIHTPDERQAGLYAEFARVIRPGGVLLLAFQVGEDVVHLTHAYGHDLDLHTRRQHPGIVTGRLVGAGFTPTAELIRQAVPPEKSPQGYVLARRDA